MTKHCETCGVRLHQRGTERNRDWFRRRTCSRRCAGQIPKSVKVEDPRGWYEVADWLRSKDALVVHGPCRSLSKDEIAALQHLYT